MKNTLISSLTKTFQWLLAAGVLATAAPACRGAEAACPLPAIGSHHLQAPLRSFALPHASFVGGVLIGQVSRLQLPQVARSLGSMAVSQTSFRAAPRLAGLASIAPQTTALTVGLGGGAIRLYAPLLAQASPNAPVSKFLDFLALIFLIVGSITITYGGFQIAGGRIQDGLVAIFGGFIIAIAIPLMKYFLASAGVPI